MTTNPTPDAARLAEIVALLSATPERHRKPDGAPVLSYEPHVTLKRSQLAYLLELVRQMQEAARWRDAESEVPEIAQEVWAQTVDGDFCQAVRLRYNEEETDVGWFDGDDDEISVRRWTYLPQQQDTP